LVTAISRWPRDFSVEFARRASQFGRSTYEDSLDTSHLVHQSIDRIANDDHTIAFDNSSVESQGREFEYSRGVGRYEWNDSKHKSKTVTVHGFRIDSELVYPAP
jgi:hypothetical protein